MPGCIDRQGPIARPVVFVDALHPIRPDHLRDPARGRVLQARRRMRSGIVDRGQALVLVIAIDPLVSRGVDDLRQRIELVVLIRRGQRLSSASRRGSVFFASRPLRSYSNRVIFPAPSDRLSSRFKGSNVCRMIPPRPSLKAVTLPASSRV